MLARSLQVEDPGASQRVVAAEWQRSGLRVRFADGATWPVPAAAVLAMHHGTPTRLALDPADPSCLVVHFDADVEHLPWDWIRSFGDSALRASSADSLRRSLGHVARRMREWRRAQGLTQQALADRAGIGRATVARLELGRGGVTLATLQRIAQAFGAGYDDVFGTLGAA